MFNNTKCANVAATYEDQVFTFYGRSFVKIIRTWTVIDWCQFNANTGFGKWTGLQVLKFNNTIDPVLLPHARDTLVCNYSESCGTTQYDFAPAQVMIARLIRYSNMSGRSTSTTTAHLISTVLYAMPKAPLPNGVHKVYYTVFDACGNQKVVSGWSP